MNGLEVIAYLDAQGITYKQSQGRLWLSDVSQLPSAMREQFDERGYFVTETEREAAKAKEEAKQATAVAEEANLEAAKEAVAVMDSLEPMAETEKEMALAKAVNPSGDTSVPSDLEVHAPQAPAAEVSKSSRGSLPDDFPHRAILAEGGVNTYAQLRKRVEAGTLTELEGIGEARAGVIRPEIRRRYTVAPNASNEEIGHKLNFAPQKQSLRNKLRGITIQIDTSISIVSRLVSDVFVDSEQIARV